ncbi:IS4 family transposase (plasmid) [Rhizobium sp. CCGE531]|nr:IS4 family transposase [Rhizobium sp. CCGE531]AYG74384.1 IS4 family transposase [Rhizobium sp. CCGE532]AYG68255.1 IS4 family transposase [Rhizobium sp. CCGE531]AYG68274.1 IS4 family transposase [Rhizobium sp. CCGE531]AYG68330.1 IS4 family transposase [Rhizobium sp. CCGE531]
MRVRKLGGNRAGEIRLSRFLRNGAVDPQAMIDEAALRTASRCADRHILAIQDTTVVRSDGGGGLYLHAMIGVDADDGAIVGAIHGQFLSRDQGERGTQRARPIEEKESYRWLEGADRAAKVCAAARHITIIADRESDIYEAFARRPVNVDLVIRVARDRSLGKDQPSLLCLADALPVAVNLAFSLPAKPGRKERDTQLAIRFSAVTLLPPKNGIYRKTPDGVRLYLVDVRETAAPPGETPIHWRLLTSYAVSDADEAAAVIALYRRRWAIEQLFRTLKTQGFDIEGLRIEDEGALSNLVMAAFVAAVIVQQLVHARDGAPPGATLRPIEDAFEPSDQPLLEAFCAKLEGKTAKQKNPHPRGSLAYAAWVCARLGGWTGYYGKPGPIVMLDGWQQFQAAKRGVALLLSAADNV